MINLNEYRNNIYNKHGIRECPCYSEDGVILKIFEEIGVDNYSRNVIEFGETRVLGTTTRSFRIKYVSNAIYFTSRIDVKSKILNFLDVLKTACVERSPKYFRFFSNMPFEYFVTPDNIEEVLSDNVKNEGDIDILTIDIDSYDYYIAKKILESENNYSPRLLILEYNPSLPIDIALSYPRKESFGRPSNRKVYGASYLAMDNLAKNHGYKLVHISGFCNLFYIRKDFSHMFSSPDVAREVTDTKEKILSFINSFCQKGFVPSWIEEDELSANDLLFFDRV